MAFSRIKYVGTAPAADANTYNLYTTAGAPANLAALAGFGKVSLDLKNSAAGTLKAYKGVRDTVGTVTWSQIAQEAISAAAASASNYREYFVAPFGDWKLDWVNGGSAQTTWLVDVSLEPSRGGDVRVTNTAAAVDEDAGVVKVENRYSATNITAATTTVVKASSGFLHAITINTLVAAATITIFDQTSAAAPGIALITLPAAGAGDMPVTLPYNVNFANGLTIVTSGATDLTVSYR